MLDRMFREIYTGTGKLGDYPMTRTLFYDDMSHHYNLLGGGRYNPNRWIGGFHRFKKLSKIMQDVG